MQQYDAIIIGAGLSGLAAGIRLAHFGKRVVILERHALVGGLNSYYKRQNVTIDVGLHALTNFALRGQRGAPLTKLLRQLRIPYEALELCEQTYSTIAFPSTTLRFSNCFDDLRASVCEAFPAQLDGFDRLARDVDAYDAFSLEHSPRMARAVLAEYLTEPLLVEMLLCPLMYYGNAREDDMPFDDFVVMWKSLFTSGFSRPKHGMAHVLRLLQERYAECGGELRLRCGVTELVVKDGRIDHVRLESGEELCAPAIFSSAGWVETMRLCSDQPRDAYSSDTGRLSFVELITFLDAPASSLGFGETIRFFNTENTFCYRAPDGLISTASGVLCCPNNYQGHADQPVQTFRITAQASWNAWRDLAGAETSDMIPPEKKDAYESAKDAVIEQLLATAEAQGVALRGHITFTDLFTPLTIQRFTGHVGGAVYGSPAKDREGRTPYANLHRIGTDQGFLGIIGSLLSGISVANLYGLQ